MAVEEETAAVAVFARMEANHVPPMPQPNRRLFVTFSCVDCTIDMLLRCVVAFPHSPIPCSSLSLMNLCFFHYQSTCRTPFGVACVVQLPTRHGADNNADKQSAGKTTDTILSFVLSHIACLEFQLSKVVSAALHHLIFTAAKLVVKSAQQGNQVEFIVSLLSCG